MSLQENRLYHFYNQGNNRGRIFFSRENYVYFLAKFRKYVWPHCQVLAYCLMPNHFHFLINTTKDSVVGLKNGLLCNQQAAIDLLDISKETLYQESYQAVPPGVLKKLL